MLHLERRDHASPLFAALSPFLALAITVGLGSLVFLAIGKSPIAGFHAYFLEPLSEVWSVHELLVKATPLILIGAGLCVCFRSGNWNIGAEGQFVMGGVAGALVPVLLPTWDVAIALPLTLLCGAIGGAAYAAIPALLKVRVGANEILSSLMLVYVAGLFADWLVRGPWRDPSGYGFPGTPTFGEAYVLPDLVTGGSLAGSTHFGFPIAIGIALALGLMMGRSLKGFEIVLAGEAPRAGRFAGFDPARTTLFAFLVSGALAGLAGIIEVTGNVGKLDEKLSLGYGFAAIIVAFLGRLNPYGVIASSLILALTYLGGEAAQISIGISDKVSSIFQGMLLVAVLGCDTLINYRVGWHRRVGHA